MQQIMKYFFADKQNKHISDTILIIVSEMCVLYVSKEKCRNLLHRLKLKESYFSSQLVESMRNVTQLKGNRIATVFRCS
jgi:hypothetical protein